ncbi:MAG: tRNA (N6-threonylcarbamoyladenosine(37)-N6)-methyltransferase TrmO [Candidatus Latescibacteria bacterium]|jgi:tRNA (adenine37-N6)-methyltransferase|nr:tRNA (N6-threonylcarbamoyladenosine(37)-N6)-methyltransferase TrmO [Candidatus Latescibacterota bacterium]
MIMDVKPLGIINTPFTESTGTPIQPRMAHGALGTVEVFDEYVPGLKDIEGFERIWLLFWCHQAASPKLHVKPYMDTREHGLFTTRAPARPNPIGISSVRLLEVKENILKVADVDMLDGTPLLDIKPYAPKFDCFEVQRCGWLDTVNNHSGLADNRFEQTRNIKEDNK